MAPDSEAIPNHLLEQREAAPDELQHYFIQFEDYWERKLWHELTNHLIEYFSLPESAPQRISLYNGFIKSFASKINKLQLVTLGLSAAEQFKGTWEHCWSVITHKPQTKPRDWSSCRLWPTRSMRQHRKMPTSLRL
jgi:hypothetical protein